MTVTRKLFERWFLDSKALLEEIEAHCCYNRPMSPVFLIESKDVIEAAVSSCKLVDRQLEEGKLVIGDEELALYHVYRDLIIPRVIGVYASYVGV